MGRDSHRDEGLVSDSGFSPVFDKIAERFGLMTAAVYGATWRHCHMRDGVCRASTRRIARLLGVNEATVQRHLRWLVKEGYLEDTTPGRRNRPHVFRLANVVKPPAKRRSDRAGIQE